ncbi:MAG: ribulose-phosphate 3-epimerase [Bifidobacteriaceae bacterium]|jgi:ribulose-phosphate 3-epimerase|nr:ribulose-phosphate 3-epimerase [Bifidobacteriaceae bacterium]
MSQIAIAPSILSCDFTNVASELQSIISADWVHIDVMDYKFVPNLTFGGPVAEQYIKANPIKSDVHLMIDNPDRWALDYAKMGANSVTFHNLAVSAPVRLARALKELGCQAAIALRPAEPVEPLFDILDEFDMVLIMTVEPGFGGQKFLANQMNKVRRLRDFIVKNNLSTQIEVDGGITSQNVHLAAAAGANIFVAGSAVFNAKNRADEIALIRQNATKAYGY